MLSAAEYGARYLVQRPFGAGDGGAVVFLVSRAVDGRLDPHRPPVLHAVAPDAGSGPGAWPCLPAAPGADGRRPLALLARFRVGLAPPPAAGTPAARIVPPGAPAAVRVTELELPPGSHPFAGQDGRWYLRRQVRPWPGEAGTELCPLDGWRPVP